MLTLKAARVNAMYTLVQASKLIGISSNTLSSWERGETHPTWKQLIKVANVYNVNISDLIFLEK